MSANAGSGWVEVVGDVLYDVENDSGLVADFLCSFDPLLIALLVEVIGSH
jgi:hypothetical protein